jgi:hypothetical protein
LPPPDTFQNAPELRPDLVCYWKAFDELSTCRTYAGMSGLPAAIPWTAINEYAIRHRFTGEAFDDLVEIVRAIDDAFRDHAMMKAKTDSGES